MTECVFPKAVAQLVANIINNTFISIDSTNRVEAVTPYTLKFDRRVEGNEVSIVDKQLDAHDGSYLSPRRT